MIPAFNGGIDRKMHKKYIYELLMNMKVNFYNLNINPQILGLVFIPNNLFNLCRHLQACISFKSWLNDKAGKLYDKNMHRKIH